MSLWHRVLTIVHFNLTTYLQKEFIMSFEPNFLVAFAAPPLLAASLQAYLISALTRLKGDLNEVALTQRLGPTGGDYDNPLFFAGALSLSEAEILLIKSEFRSGGDLYDAGVRARRLFFPPKEVAAPDEAEGKLTVQVIGAEDLPVPEGQDWSATRLTKDAFFKELGAPGNALVVLEAPPDNI